MRDYIEINLKEINKHFKKRKKIVSKSNKISITEEYKEWTEIPFVDKKLIWTLPDLTSTDRLNNFCRSIKKEIR